MNIILCPLSGYSLPTNIKDLGVILGILYTPYLDHSLAEKILILNIYLKNTKYGLHQLFSSKKKPN